MSKRHTFVFTLVSLLTFTSALYGQTERDAVLDITFPTSDTVVDTDTVAVEFTLATFFAIGDSGCAGCDGFIRVYLNDGFYGNIHSAAPYTISGLVDGGYFLELVVVDPSGNSFTPSVGDTTSFSVDIPSMANLCEPKNLEVNAGDTRNYLTWDEPTPGLGGDIGCGDFLVTSLPFSVTGSNVGMGNEWDVTGGDGDDVAYTLNLTEDMTITFDMCSALTDYDCKLEIFSGCPPDEISLAYDDDGPFGTCPQSPAPYTPSLIEDLFLPAGQYYVVVDGFGGATGNYELFITVSVRGQEVVYSFENELAEEFDKLAALGASPAELEALMSELVAQEEQYRRNTRDVDPECGQFLNYSVLDAATQTVIASVDTTLFVHENLTNGVEYCYQIVANYSEGTSAPTSVVCGTPQTFIPAPVTNLSAVGLDEEVFLSWTDPYTPQYTFYENFNQGITPAWTVTDNMGNGIVWTAMEDPTTAFDGLFATCISDGNPPSDSDLISPAIDLSPYSDGMLYYNYNFQKFASYADTGKVYISGDNGATWQLMKVYNADTPGGFSVAPLDSIPLTAVAGSTQVRLKFHYHDYDGNAWWFRIDDIRVVGLGTATRDLTGSSVTCLGDYIPGNRHIIDFSLTLVAPDWAYCDSFAMTFPAGVTINAAGPELLGTGGSTYPPEAFNGITGQTISWGEDNNDAAGGIFGTLPFWVDLTFADTLSGPVPVAFHFSDDGWDTPVDASGTVAIPQRILVDGMLLGYNVYVDGAANPVNPFLLENSNYLARNLVNGQNYGFGVTARYYPDYESVPATVTATPTWMFGDISGTVRDANQVTLDSAIVSVGTLRDTTGTAGTYLLSGLTPGTYTVKVTRPGFEGDEAQVTVSAQEAPVVQDFVLQPKLARPGGLEALAGDLSISLKWNSPGGEEQYDLAYYDDLFESQIGCGGGCMFGVRFTPLGYPAALNSILVSVQGDASVAGGNLVAYLDPSGTVGGPAGLTGTTLLTGLDLSSPDGSLTQYLIDLSSLNIVVDQGDIYLIIEEASSGWMGIANDIQPQSPEFYDRNWVFTSSTWSTIYDAVGGDPTLTGDFGMLSSWTGVTGRMVTLDSRNEVVRPSQVPYTGVLGASDPDPAREPAGGSFLPNSLVSIVEDFIRPNLPRDWSREDSLLGYSVYQVTGAGDTLVAETLSEDTTAAISVPANYVEYCYNVKAKWQTQDYGVLLSKPSANACAIPFTRGDINFDSSVDITDLLGVVDFVLMVTSPTPEEFRGADVNHDGSINIQDVVMIVDIIYGLPPLGRMVAADPQAVATLALTASGQSSLQLDLDYEGLIRGVQFTLRFDRKQTEPAEPVLGPAHDQSLVFSRRTGADAVTYLVLATGATGFDLDSEPFISIPVVMDAGQSPSVNVHLVGSLAAGADGVLIPVTERTSVVELEILPTEYALQQNYPNPFNPVTEIQFAIPEAGNVQLVIYNLAGQKIRTLVHSPLQAGYHMVRWNGRNDQNQLVGTGMYIYQLSTGTWRATRKMVLLK